MTATKFLFALFLTAGLTAFAASPSGLSQKAPRLTKAEIAAAGLADPADHPEGYYVSEDGDLSLRITKSGLVKPDFSVKLTNGTSLPLDFPRKLRYIADEEVYRTKGETTISYYTTIGLLTCRHPVTFEFEDLLGKGETLRLHATLPQTFGLDAYGRCLSYGQRHITVKFIRE